MGSSSWTAATHIAQSRATAASPTVLEITFRFVGTATVTSTGMHGAHMSTESDYDEITVDGVGHSVGFQLCRA